MKVTEQIDALESLAVDSMKYLASTRVIACMISQPLLTTLFNFAAISGGFVAETFLSNISFELYFQRAFSSITFIDYIPATLKTVVFGFLIASISGYLGYNARGGAAGVGRASTQSVVTSSIVLIIVNVVLVRVIFFLFPEAQ
jgi:phospholipid/cholesterol/gamma-HCH transport system permease protein